MKKMILGIFLVLGFMPNVEAGTGGKVAGGIFGALALGSILSSAANS